jgi:hypothetical protein
MHTKGTHVKAKGKKARSNREGSKIHKMYKKDTKKDKKVHTKKQQ